MMMSIPFLQVSLTPCQWGVAVWSCCYCSAITSCMTLWDPRLPCPSLPPWVCANSCPLSQWYYLAISFSATLFFCNIVLANEKVECRRIDAFELWCWRRLLRFSWTVRKSNQSILKEISPGCSLEGLMLKLKLQYFGHLMWRADSFEKTLMLGKI